MLVITIWTATTDGDECPLTTTAHGSEEDMLRRVRADLLHDILEFPVNALDGVEKMDAEQLKGLWEKLNDGTCVMQWHTVAI